MPYDDLERRKWQDPEAILKELGLKPGMVFADIGCGSGFFALPAARMAGEQGKVYGIDVNPGAIGKLQEQAKREKLNNLALKAGKAEETLLCRRCADIVFIGIALHDFQDPSLVLENARRTIKTGGILCNLDWKKEAMPFGPPVSIRFDEKTASRLIEAAGFKVDTVKESGPYHYIIMASPSLSHKAAHGCRLD